MSASRTKRDNNAITSIAIIACTIFAGVVCGLGYGYMYTPLSVVGDVFLLRGCLRARMIIRIQIVFVLFFAETCLRINSCLKLLINYLAKLVCGLMRNLTPTHLARGP